jgi:hypothetical protein
MRRNRIEFDGAVYHAIQRSSNRENKYAVKLKLRKTNY